ncbi:hypothetical protein Avbf_10221 [Armadillidium vulgare]|nr:hypothetical protein Avbf_10221 [Armadillidium vulgare]
MDTRKRRKEGGTSQSLVFESLHSLPKRAKVHAQRKFAQGTQPNSPAVTPVKEFRELRDRIVPTECRTRLNLTTQSVITTHQQQSIVPSLTSSLARPKTEDFLTFLCFRRTALLPPELEFFETPQLLENSVDSSHGITPPHDDKSSKSFKKKEEFGFENEKKAGARRHCVRLRGKSSKRRSIITRANSTSEGSPTLNLVARKNNAKRLFMKRNKEQLSRILKSQNLQSADEVLDIKETKPLMEEGSDGNKKPQKESEKVEVLQEKCKNTSPRQSLKLLKNLSCKEVLRKRKLNLVDKRVTRRLIYNKEKKVEVNEGETVAENTMKLRCKRSVSDALVSETKSSAGTKNIVPERSKSTDSRSSESSRKNLREKSLYNETVEEPEPPSLRNRPSRKTKRVAEVYLELISQRLAKESQKGQNKELNVEKCVQELVERHQGKEPKVSTSDSKEKEPQNIITKSASVKQNLNQAQNPVQNPQSTDDSRRMELRSSDVIFDSIVNYEENNSTNSKKKTISNTLSLKKSRSSKSSDSDSPPVLGKRRESLLSRLGRGSKSPKQITPVHNDKSPVVLRSSSHSPSPQSQRKIVEHVSPKEPPYQTRSSEIQKEVQISPKGLRRRASAECPKIDKKETVRRLSYDPKPLKNQVESCEINTLSLNLRKRESRKVPVNARKSNDLEDETACESDNSISYTSKCSKPSNLTTEKSKIKIEETLILSDTPLNIKENSTIHATEAPESSTKEKEKLVLNLPTENIKPKEENNLGSATDTVKSVPRFSKKNSKPKRLPLSPRFKRTLSLGSEQSSSQNCDQLRKCGSEESVVKSCSNKELSKTTELLTLSTSVQSGNSVQHKSNVAKDIKQKGNEILSQVRKPIFSRRRSSIHDEAKLNAVLESVAKDFEKDMDDQLFDKIEKDLNAGNKSPDKTNKSFLETLKSKQPLLTEKESSALNIDINSRSSPVTQSSSSSSSPVPTRKSSNSKKLCDVVRNLQERKQAESPHSFNDSATPSFLQDLKSLDSRSLDKPKQVSEEAVVMQPFDLALAPNISHSTDSDNSLVTLNSTTHSCTSDHKKAPEDIFIKSIKCSDDRKEMVNNQNDSSPSEKESVSPLTVPSIDCIKY